MNLIYIHREDILLVLLSVRRHAKEVKENLAIKFNPQIAQQRNRALWSRCLITDQSGAFIKKRTLKSFVLGSRDASSLRLQTGQWLIKPCSRSLFFQLKRKAAVAEWVIGERNGGWLGDFEGSNRGNSFPPSLGAVKLLRLASSLQRFDVDEPWKLKETCEDLKLVSIFISQFIAHMRCLTQSFKSNAFCLPFIIRLICNFEY